MIEFKAVTASEIVSVATVVLEQLELTSNTEQATLLALFGDLGAGKTTFVQALAKLLGVTETVTSPTFVIMKNYQTAYPGKFKQLSHLDCYRLETAAELKPLNFAELLKQPSTLVCVEWPERIEALLPEKKLELHINNLDNDKRDFILKIKDSLSSTVS